MAGMRFLLGLSIFGAVFGFMGSAMAGGEEEKQEKSKKEQKAPEDTALPKEAETPGFSVGDSQEPIEAYEDFTSSQPVGKKGKSFGYHENSLDDNIDYSRLLDQVEVSDALAGVLPPALGFRGYRPSMIAVGAGDRVPGYGGLMEYSWNRVGIGVFASYRSNQGEDRAVSAFGLAGLYGMYRWLPFDISPYFLLGIEAGSATDEPVGGLTGLGVETRILSGWTMLVGWTFHSPVHRGFFGGALGWSF